MSAVRTNADRQTHAGIDPNERTLCGELIARVVMSEGMTPVPFVIAPAAERCPWCHWQLWHTRAGAR